MDSKLVQATRQWTLVQPVVSAYVGAVVRDFAMRDDVLQEVAVAVLESYDRFDASKSFQAWALGVARIQIRAYLRSRSRDRLTFDEKVIANLADAFDQEASSVQPKLENLQDCLAKLDVKARQILELRYAEDLKPSAIASQLELVPNTVAKALQRIRDLLRKCIDRRVVEENWS